jgi:Flp pilus assembly protein TadG
LARRTATAELGAGLIATLFGALVFLLCLLFAVQLLVGLYARSVVTAAAYEAARMVAGAGAYGDAGGQEATVAAAEATARSRLGGLASRANFTWREVDGNRVVLEVRLVGPQFVPERLAPLEVIDRTVIVRTERFR